MFLHKFLRFSVCAVLAAGASVVAADDGDSDEVEKVGIAAAFGLTAADGKTALGAGAGAIEAALLETDAINQAGAIIAALVKDHGATANILLLTSSETVNAATYFAVKRRLEAVSEFVASTKMCKDPAAKADIPGGDDKFAALLGKKLKLPGGTIVSPSVADIIPAVATSTSFAPVSLSVEDRALTGAILLNKGAKLKVSAKASDRVGPVRWQSATFGPSETQAVAFRLPAEMQGDPRASALLQSYDRMLRGADALRHCAEDAKAKAAVSAADALAVSLNAVTDKAPVAPLALAVQQEGLYDSGGVKILRVSIEQSGGTSRTRSGLIYTFGVPGAAVVSAGLVVSFRLIDTAAGITSLAGVVRCGVAPRKMGSVARFAQAEVVEGKEDSSVSKATCSYLVG
ncbi:hypothetical protein MTR62_08470 [Novosphingobium sp. 1949]|uniref:Uncharacterized protein n=1 Tax=Novosphingobium organovorum TaxID=2930092 RepID=A0ABT0BCK2_9SPHN|nr:hypothetical protein [Novosphingobium organovorum]MCJ2182723.1 hypothetical protein [Novosphingobium organovorum]